MYLSDSSTDTSIENLQDTTIDFSNSQSLVTVFSNQFQASFSDIEDLYTEMLFETNILVSTKSEKFLLMASFHLKTQQFTST